MSTETASRSPSEWIEHIDNEVGRFQDEAAAILDAAAKNDGGQWTDEQKARYDEIMGPQGKENEGLIAKLQDDRGRWSDIEAKQHALQQDRAREREKALGQAKLNHNNVSVPTNVHTGVGVYCLDSKKPVVVPAKARSHRPLPEAIDSPELAYAAGMWFTAVLFDYEPGIKFCRDHGIQMQQEVGTPGKGGYLAPTELERSVIQIREMFGIVRAHSRVFGMMSETKDLPKDMNGIVVTPAAEKSDLKANNATSKDWVRPQLIARKWAGYTTFTSELDESAIIDIGADLTRDYARAFAKAEDDAGFNGDGTGGYNSITGIREALLASSTITLPVNASPAIGDLTVDHYLEAVGKPPNTEDDRAAWYCHKTVWAQSIQPLAQAGGGNTIRDLEAGANTVPGGTGRRPNFMWQGYPGYWVNVMPKATDVAALLKGIVVFGDLNAGVAFGDKRGVTVRLSEHAEFITDETAVRGTERFDVIVHETGTATPTDPAGTIVQINFGAAA